jgi:hypothetical protein
MPAYHSSPVLDTATPGAWFFLALGIYGFLCRVQKVAILFRLFAGGARFSE